MCVEGACGWVEGNACHVGGLSLWGWGCSTSVQLGFFLGHLISTCDECC